jgi:hypothetical protein
VVASVPGAADPGGLEGVVAKLLSRNYHLALLALIAGIVAMFENILSGPQYVSLALGIVTSFRAGDAIVNWINAKKEISNVGK